MRIIIQSTSLDMTYVPTLEILHYLYIFSQPTFLLLKTLREKLHKIDDNSQMTFCNFVALKRIDVRVHIIITIKNYTHNLIVREAQMTVLNL